MLSHQIMNTVEIVQNSCLYLGSINVRETGCDVTIRLNKLHLSNVNKINHLE